MISVATAAEMQVASDAMEFERAAALRDRLKAYTQAQEDPRLQTLVSRVHGLDTIVTRSETEALVLEENLIKIKKPKFNVRLRDDKKFPYLKVTVKERFPRIFPSQYHSMAPTSGYSSAGCSPAEPASA